MDNYYDALNNCKDNLASINWWPEGESNREIIIELTKCVSLLLEIELERERSE